MLWSGDGRGGGGGPGHALVHVLQRRIVLLLLPLTLLLLLQLVTHQLGKTQWFNASPALSPRGGCGDYGRGQRGESCVLPAYADQCVRPWLGGEGAEEGEPMSEHHSPAREVDEAVEQKKKNKHEKEMNQWHLLSLK